jgi:hypothetical protein
VGVSNGDGLIWVLRITIIDGGGRVLCRLFFVDKNNSIAGVIMGSFSYSSPPTSPSTSGHHDYAFYCRGFNRR